MLLVIPAQDHGKQAYLTKRQNRRETSYIYLKKLDNTNNREIKETSKEGKIATRKDEREVN